MPLAGPRQHRHAPVLVGEKHLGAQLFGLMLQWGPTWIPTASSVSAMPGRPAMVPHIQPRVGDQQVPTISAPVQVGYRTVTGVVLPTILRQS